MTGKRLMQLVAVAGMAMAVAACAGSNPSDPPPPVTTSQPAPPPVTTSQPAPPPVTTSQSAGPGPYESSCYYTVGILGEGLAMSLNGQTADCTDAAAAFENAIGNAYAVAGADDSVVAIALCSGTISDSAGNYTGTVYASPDTGINNAVGSQDPVCIKLGWTNLRLGGRCPVESTT